MLQLRRYKHGGFRTYCPSAQTHCEEADVEAWIRAAGSASGVIARARIEIDGTGVPLSSEAQVSAAAAMYAADHNEHVTQNLQYAREAPEEISDIEVCESDEEMSRDEVMLEPDFELNEELTVNEFGSSHQKYHEW